ncbi:Fe(3+)-hydroxamate ABC transporter permease FhuB [Providencia sneebia]|uniref:Iron-hydroxamate transporter permease subunit n=1 Tax=Providencia sneebia DSM 19967 TaxID=1141660 RepID=K8W6T3_9GAMM|nr:iron-hydroxamate transporter permease subunit [Providencia sneebia DSM 19967]
MITTKHYLTFFMLLLLFVVINLQLEPGLSLFQQYQLIIRPNSVHNFADFFFLYGQLPRLVMALVVGATFGLIGSVMQQLTQNNLTSPLTLGSSSGAWLALVIVNIWFAHDAGFYSSFAAMIGALFAFGFVILIAGVHNMTGLPLVVSGMVVNILLGAIATALITLNSQFTQNIFMWGAGNLAQDGWQKIYWLLPALFPIIIIIGFAPRILTLLRLGHEGAQARGLSVLPAFLFFIVLATWLVAATITTVGVISFIGLLAPNIVRQLGQLSARKELMMSAGVGAILLLCADSGAIALSNYLNIVVPTGVMTAAIGAPLLIWFSRRALTAQDQLSIGMLSTTLRLSKLTVLALLLLLFAGIIATLFLHTDGTHFYWSQPSIFQWALKWPRLLAALFAGLALSIAGVLLQRIIYNPLASPDILGVSSGASAALVLTSLLLGTAIQTSLSGVALLGSLAVLTLLLILGRRQHYAPASVILTGICLTATLEAFVQFFLAQGTLSSYRILLWLSGSTYRMNGSQALIFAFAVLILCTLTICLSRWLTLLSVSRTFAQGRGLHAQKANILLLVLVALLCALVTSTVGPIAFIGLIAPHMAFLLGAKKAKQQLIIGGLIGAILMLWADWLGQTVIYPAQIAAGIFVAILGGGYFLLLMALNRMK